MGFTWGRDRELARLAAAVDAGRSVVVAGPLGIGKSRLLGQFVADRPSDWWSVQVVANEAASAIPFGAVAMLLPPVDARDQAGLLRAAVDRFVRSAAGHRPVVVIDDADHLDPASTALLYEICVSRDVPLVATYRVGEPLPVPVAELFKEVAAERLDLGPLSRDDVAHVAAQMLPSSPRDALVDELMARSAGNPLFLVELLRAERAEAPDGLPGRLSDLVRARLAALSGDTQAVMEYIALAEPITVALPLIGDKALVELERGGLVVTVERSDGVVVARSAHPLYGEVVRAAMTPATRRLAARRLSDAMLTTERRGRGDAFRLAGWLLDIGEVPEPQLAVEAAREALAWFETDLAHRLIEQALACGVTYHATYVAGEICRAMGDVACAKRRFEEALRLADDDSQVREASLSLAFLHAFFDGDPNTSVSVLERAASHVTDPARRLELGVERNFFWVLLGEHDNITAAASEALADPACDDGTEWAALLSSLWAESQTMQLSESLGHIERALSHVDDPTIALPGAIDLLHALDVSIRGEMGLLQDAVDRGAAWIDAAPDVGVPSGLTQLVSVSIRWSSGEIAAARAVCERAIAQLSAFDPFNALPLAMFEAAIVCAVDGDQTTARHHFARGHARSDATAFGELWRWRAEAWLAGWSDPELAVKSFVESARCAFDKSQGASALTALHEALPFDGAHAVVGELDRMGREPVEAPYMELVVRHIRARAAHDRAQIIECAERFVAIGAIWQATDAWQAVARLSTSDSERARASTRAVMTGLPLALGLHAGEITTWSLSPRQTEIARRAAVGTTSRDIASEMDLAVRTVDNHLRSIYRALGIDGRSALADALGC